MFWGVLGFLKSVSEYFSLFQKGLCFCRTFWESKKLLKGVSMMLHSSFNAYQDFSEGSAEVSVGMRRDLWSLQEIFERFLEEF